MSGMRAALPPADHMSPSSLKLRQRSREKIHRKSGQTERVLEKLSNNLLAQTIAVNSD